MTICLIVILAALLLHLKFGGDAMLKLIEIGRKENTKQLERKLEVIEEKIGKLEKSLTNQPKKFDNAKELIDLLKDFKEEKSAEFQKFITWTKQQ